MTRGWFRNKRRPPSGPLTTQEQSDADDVAAEESSHREPEAEPDAPAEQDEGEKPAP